METETLAVVLEAVRQLSTELFFVLLLIQFTGYVLAVVFSLDLLGILLTVLLGRYAEHHLALRPMAERLDRPAPYGRADRSAVYDAFVRGLEAAGIRRPPAPPRPPGP